MINICEDLDKEFVELRKEVEKKSDMGLVIKGNGIKRKCEEKRSEIVGIEDTIVLIKKKEKKYT